MCTTNQIHQSTPTMSYHCNVPTDNKQIRYSPTPSFIEMLPLSNRDYYYHDTDLQDRSIYTTSHQFKPSTEQYGAIIKKHLANSATTAGHVAAVTTSALVTGIAQSVVDANDWRVWSLNKIYEWGWNESKFGQACSILMSAASMASGGAIGLIRGVYEGGTQSHYKHQQGMGIWDIMKYTFANAFYACEPTQLTQILPQPHYNILPAGESR